MSPREESVLSHAQDLAISLLQRSLPSEAVSVKIKIETVDKMTITVEINIGG